MNEEQNTALIELISTNYARSAKMSYLLGIAIGGIYNIIQDETSDNFQKEPLLNLLGMLQKGINELYYSQDEKRDEL